MIGRYLETVGGARARKDIRNLLSLQPQTANRRQGEDWAEVRADALAPGDTILVRPGERVPADAEIAEGRAALDEALLTGESLPVEKSEGDTVFAGSVVTDAALICQVTLSPKDTRLAQITTLVEHTLASKPPIQRLADRAAAYFAFGIVAVAAATIAGWTLSGHATAQALLAGGGRAGGGLPLRVGPGHAPGPDRGFGPRHPVPESWCATRAALETAASIRRMVFDKTGTLTRGRMAVVATEAAPEAGLSSDELLRMAAAVEQFSEHPHRPGHRGELPRSAAPGPVGFRRCGAWA